MNNYMTRKQFKKRWEYNAEGGGITFEDVAECAKAWGICSNPRIHPMDEILKKVLAEANVKE